MAQLVKLDVQTELKSPANKVYDIYRRKMYLMPKYALSLYKTSKLLRDWETVGSVKLWKYVAGTSESTSEALEVIDDGSKAITMNVSDGDAAKYYKTLKSTMCVTDSGEGSLVKCTLTYEKKNQNIPDPYQCRYYGQIYRCLPSQAIGKDDDAYKTCSGA